MMTKLPREYRYRCLKCPGVEYIAPISIHHLRMSCPHCGGMLLNFNDYAKLQGKTFIDSGIRDEFEERRPDIKAIRLLFEKYPKRKLNQLPRA